MNRRPPRSTPTAPLFPYTTPFRSNREFFNIAHESITRHADGSGRTAVRIAHSDGRDEILSFDQIAAGSARFAHWLVKHDIKPGDRIAFMLEPSLPFYLSLFVAMMMGAISVPMFTLFGLDGFRLRLDDCKPKLLITNAEKAERSEQHTSELPSLMRISYAVF